MFGRMGTLFGKMGRAGATVPYTFVNAEAAAVSAAMKTAGSEPDYTRKAAIDGFWTDIKAAGLDSDLEILYFPAAHSNAAGLIEWMAPTGNFTAIDVNAVVFEADRGAIGDGVSARRRTQYIPNTHKVKISLNDTGIGFYCRTDSSSGNIPFGARTTSTTGQLFFNPRGAVNAVSHRVNQDAVGANLTNADSRGHFLSQRTASGLREIFRNNISLGTDTTVSTSMPTTEMVMFGLNTGGTVGSFDTRQLSCVYITKSLSSAKRTALHNAIGRYGSTLGFFFGIVGAWSWFVQTPAKIINSELTVWFTDDVGGARYGIPASNGVIYWAGTIGDSGPQDDHSNPCAPLRRDSDGKYISFWTGHNIANLYMSVSTNADDVRSGFAAAVDIASQLGVVFYSYPNPYQLLGEANDPIYLFFRAATDTVPNNWGPWYSKTIDGGTTWDAATRYVAGVRPYIQSCQNGDDRIDFAVSTGQPDEAVNSLYHFYFTGGSFYATDGGVALTLPIDLTTLTPFWDAVAQGVEAWQWQVKIDGNGRPRILFATFPTPASDHRYYHARWTGAAWVVNQICTAGGPIYSGQLYYSGGICFDPDNLSIIYASRKINGVFNIWKFTTSDNGVTWDAGIQLTNFSDNAYRPHCVSGVTEPRLVVMRGSYTSYTDFATRMEAISSVPV